MSTFLLCIAAGILAVTVVGLWRAVRGPAITDRLGAVQMLGSGAIAALMLAATASGARGAIDVALVLALLAPFATIGVVHARLGRDGDIA